MSFDRQLINDRLIDNAGGIFFWIGFGALELAYIIYSVYRKVKHFLDTADDEQNLDIENLTAREELLIRQTARPITEDAKLKERLKAIQTRHNKISDKLRRIDFTINAMATVVKRIWP
jgi:hypothetical protein